MIVIAEIGINHNGNIDLAHELIRQARINGADIAKFQFYDPDKLFGPAGSHPDPDNHEFALKVTFGFDQAKRLKTWCDEEGIEFMASVFDEERFQWMEELGVRRHKIASRTVQERDLCEKILATGKETFISLGLWEGEGVPYAVENARYLYCVTKYPCEYGDIVMPDSFGKSIYDGFSDHSLGTEASLVAIGRGATVIEKHFTLNKGLEGPDHVCSITPDELREIVVLGRRFGKVVRLCRGA